MLVKTLASAVEGVDARTIIVEANAGGNVQDGKPWYNVIGLPDSSIREGNFRVETAIKNSGYNCKRIKVIINLAPADVRKEGSAYDFPIAMALLTESSVGVVIASS